MMDERVLCLKVFKECMKFGSFAVLVELDGYSTKLDGERALAVQETFLDRMCMSSRLPVRALNRIEYAACFTVGSIHPNHVD